MGFLIFLLFTPVFAAVPRQIQDFSYLLYRTAKVVSWDDTGTSSGSGMSLGNGRVLSTTHILHFSKIGITFSTDNSIREAVIESSDTLSDLVILRAYNTTKPAVILSDNHIVGDSVTFCGNLPNRDFICKKGRIISIGIYKILSGFIREMLVIEVDKKYKEDTYGGFSGSAVMKFDGYVVGMIEMEGDGFIFAITGKEILEYLKNAK